ncbi:hypothetical protein BBP40_004593 [Aspergillus hancockii]|nr:hypothetical protein BBP40_004593 [Aspergillus hancockii]
MAGTSTMKLKPHDKTVLYRNIKPADDWRNLTDRVERRRRQNRLNQRTYRFRHKLLAQVSSKQQETLLPAVNIYQVPLQTKHQQQILSSLTSAAYQSYIIGHPTTDHLLSLTRINVYRAYINNLSLIGVVIDEHLCDDDLISPFNQIGPVVQPKPGPKVYPRSLHPSSTQRSRSHHPWLDFFPHPRVRDNLIRAQDQYDEDDLCLDILGFWNPHPADNMLLVWGEPHDPANWEVTESFIKKWGWAIRGCPEILCNTNRWRARRGENLIFRYL